MVPSSCSLAAPARCGFQEWRSGCSGRGAAQTGVTPSQASLLWRRKVAQVHTCTQHIHAVHIYTQYSHTYKHMHSASPWGLPLLPHRFRVGFLPTVSCSRHLPGMGGAGRLGAGGAGVEGGGGGRRAGAAGMAGGLAAGGSSQKWPDGDQAGTGRLGD